ncbi:MAG: gliding motility-associated C-terminal domain-containing protein, partial [Bacteroidetes bacterium]|nr:gliding motility-associated C-terminal domain-containing protein [Bacteroidota bacterium]
VPASWLNNPKLVYPLIIDPTTTNTYASNQAVNDKNAQFSSACQATMNLSFPAGTYSVTGTNTSYRIWAKGYIGSSLVAFVDIYADIKEQRSRVGSIAGWSAMQSGPAITNHNGSGASYTSANNGNTYNLTNQTIANGCYTNTLTIPFYWQGWQAFFPYTPATDVPAALVSGCITNYQELVTNTWVVTVTYVIGGTTPTFAIPSSICAGAALSLPATSSNGITGTWSPAANNTATTTYTFMPNAGQCALTTTVQVLVNPAPTVTVNSASICSGGTATLTANGASTYTWNTGSTSNPLVVSPSSTTSYTVTGANGTCTNTAIATVIMGSSLTISVNSASICSGGTATLTASGATAYSWNTGSTSNPLIVSPSSTTSYTVTGTTGSCSNTAVATVSVSAAPNLSLAANTYTICNGASQPFSASGANTYTWSPAASLNNANSASPISNANATTVYTVSGTTSGCLPSAPLTLTLTVNALPMPIATSNTPCLNQALTFSCSPGGLANYVWMGPNNFTAIGANPSVAVSTATLAGVYTVTVMDNNLPACINHATVSVSVNSLPIITATALPACIGQTIHFSASGAVSYQWSGPGSPAFSSTLQNPQIPNASSTNAGNYAVLGTDAHGCQGGNVVNVLVNTLPTISVNTATICSGQQTATLTASGAATYMWSGGTSPSIGNIVNASPTIATTYTVTGTDVNGCSNTANAAVSVFSLPIVSTNTVAPACAPLCTSFSVTSSTSVIGYSWSLGNGATATTASPSMCYTVAGTTPIKVVVTDLNGCTNSATTLVMVLPVPQANFDYSPQPVGILDPNVQFTNTSLQGGTASHWNFGDGNTSSALNPTHTYADTGSYQVTLIVASAQGCADTLVKTIVINDDYALYVPNAFTPNGDNLNDVFLPIANGIKEYTLYIYDRWGNLTFQSKDVTKGWDGTKGAVLVQADVYVWKIDVTNVQNKVKSLLGIVTLLR